ncbi:MAG TPA: hypothetical protein VFC58_16460 [Desulfosporosinus sp.]|nr:hypothetical protein [Desulfosporosinus sp.]
MVSNEDKQLFIDITKKHRRNIEILTYPETAEALIQALSNMEFARVGGML